MPPLAPATELIPDHWYAVAHTRALTATRPLTVHRLAERIVLFRDEGGRARAARAACPHRGADLGLGRVVEGALECPYHGFRFDGAGACTAMPCEGRDAKIPARMHLHTRVAEEAHGFLWVFHGDDARAPGVPLPWIDDAPDDARDAARAELTWDARLSRVMEGMLDIHHLPFAHRRVMPTKRHRLDPYTAHVDDHGVIRTSGTLRTEEEPVGKGYTFHMDVAFPGVLSLRLSKNIGGVVVCTPIDEERTWIGARYVARVPLIDWIPGVRRLLAELSLWSELKLVQPDDERMVVSSDPRAGGPEHGVFVHADKGIALWHAERRHAVRGSLPVVHDAPPAREERRAATAV